jgi:hypothetical protein
VRKGHLKVKALSNLGAYPKGAGPNPLERPFSTAMNDEETNFWKLLLDQGPGFYRNLNSLPVMEPAQVPNPAPLIQKGERAILRTSLEEDRRSPIGNRGNTIRLDS